jgi:uncharacterized membrane protein
MVVLCGAGLYASAFMANKSWRAARGEVRGPSVVKSPRAKLFGGVPNSILGLAYYAGLLATLPFLDRPIVRDLAIAAAVLAAGTSLYLAHSLLFKTRRACPYCWTSHVVNWSLLLILVFGVRPQ